MSGNLHGHDIGITTDVVTTISDLQELLLTISSKSHIYLDIKGRNLGRNGTIEYVTILTDWQISMRFMRTVRIIDIQALGNAAFTTPASDGTTLRNILENPRPVKCFWDVRDKAAALWGLYGIRLAHVVDLQLLEVVSRRAGEDRKFLRTMESCVVDGTEDEARQSWRQAIFDSVNTARESEPGERFTRRPTDGWMMDYCTATVQYLPNLHTQYLSRSSQEERASAGIGSRRRVEAAQRDDYEPVLSNVSELWTGE
ncbi:hypothetical protein BT63DRAFT_473879 [Microthyrium microscopicum]|uniref:3'-5' exonuclease domain-containing protein n=1 Tax=Microthyrium microscopicum TaxID=703497 RepID=A0A6A6UT43_9PEZI|nr:hypothetical protein BT63DRAFT_473879 [Microthyrium microscopicum]